MAKEYPLMNEEIKEVTDEEKKGEDDADESRPCNNVIANDLTSYCIVFPSSQIKSKSSKKQ